LVLTPAPITVAPVSERSLVNLNWLNLLVAQMQMAFGAFLSAHLAAEQWSTRQIGVALTISTATAMLFQIPGGMLVDAIHSKRRAAAAGIFVIACAAILIGISPLKFAVYLGEALQGAASCVLGPAIAAITLALTQQDTLGERFGRNVRFSAIGSMVAAGLMGVTGFWFSHSAMFYLSTFSGIAALAAVRAIPEQDIEEAPERTDHVAAIPRRHRTRPEEPKWKVACNPLLLTFAACVGLFQLGNAAVLPIAAAAAQRADGHTVELVISAAIIVPQALAAWMSPYMGRAAHRWGRRSILLLGFAPLPIRALLFAGIANPYAIVFIQALDGISAAVVGMIVPLVVADITRRRGRFNLAMGVVGLAVGVGAAISTTFAGAIADRFGDAMAFVALAAAGLAACLLAWLVLPETGQRKHHHQIRARAA
jgi:MFS family permease